MLRFLWFIKKKKDIEEDISSLELNIPLDRIFDVGDYEKKRIEIALAISCHYVNRRNEYVLWDYISEEYWLNLADIYLSHQGVDLSTLPIKLETVEDVIKKAKIVGLDAALNGINENLFEAVFKRFAQIISHWLLIERSREEAMNKDRKRRRRC